MFKNIPIKIVLVFFLIGIIIIGGFCGFFLNSLNIISQKIQVEQNLDIGQVTDMINQLENNTKVAVIIFSIAYIIVGIIIAVILSKFVIYPINKLIKSAEKITEEESKEKKNKKKGEMSNLENVFGIMTTELKEKLSEVSTQKNQIETILLHMTDGIIAFNRKGEIILINPAAKKFLSIRPEDNTFDDIFKKFNLNINMEKIIYLENWTSTEQKIQVDDRYVKAFFAPFKDEEERPDGVIAVIQDITELLKLHNIQKEFVAVV